MSTIGDLCVTSSVSSDDKLPIWSNANGVTRGLPISVLDGRYLTSADVAALAASPTVETFTAGTDFTPGVSLALTLANQYYSAQNIEVFFDTAYQGPDQYSLVGYGLSFSTVIPVGIQHVYVRGGAVRQTGAPSDGTVTDAKVASGSKLYNRINDWIDVTDFGASQSIDSTSAFTKAAQACNAKGGGTVFIPAGRWSISATITTYPNVEFIGAGENSTIIVPTVANMTLFSCVNAAVTQTYIAFRNMTIAPSVSGVTGISLVLCRFAAVTNITFLGCATNVYIDRGYFFTLDNLTSTSVLSNLAAGSLVLTSSVDTDYVYHATISNYKLVSQGLGSPNQGVYMRRAIDSNITDLHAYGTYPNCTVVVLENDCQAVKMKGLNIDGCAAGVLLQQGAGIAVWPSFTSIANSHIDQPTAYGIHVAGATRTTIKDVMFTPTGAHVNALPIWLDSDAWSSVEGCQISGFSGNAGVQISSSRLARVVNNTIASCNIGVGFSGSPTGCTIDNSYDSVSTPIGGSPVGVGNRIKPSQYGFTPGTSFVPTSPTMPATGVSYTNSTGFTCRVSVMGGTFTGVTINGVAVGISGNNWSGDVQPDETIAITYSVAPNWFWAAK